MNLKKWSARKNTAMLVKRREIAPLGHGSNPKPELIIIKIWTVTVTCLLSC